MSIDDFVRCSKVRHALTADFLRAVPEDMWDLTPDPPGKIGRAPHSIGLAPASRRFASNCGTSSVCAVSTLPLWRQETARKHEQYVGPLTREALLTALDDKQQNLLRHTGNRRHRRADRLGRNPFTFVQFTWEFVQHEAIHHGQWSVYASLAGFEGRSAGERRGACGD